MKGFDASGVVFVRAGENGDERAGVHQHAALHFELPETFKVTGIGAEVPGGETFGRSRHSRSSQPLLPDRRRDGLRWTVRDMSRELRGRVPILAALASASGSAGAVLGSLGCEL